MKRGGIMIANVAAMVAEILVDVSMLAANLILQEGDHGDAPGC